MPFTTAPIRFNSPVSSASRWSWSLPSSSALLLPPFPPPQRSPVTPKSRPFDVFLSRRRPRPVAVAASRGNSGGGGGGEVSKGWGRLSAAATSTPPAGAASRLLLPCGGNGWALAVLRRFVLSQVTSGPWLRRRRIAALTWAHKAAPVAAIPAELGRRTTSGLLAAPGLSRLNPQQRGRLSPKGLWRSSFPTVTN